MSGGSQRHTKRACPKPTLTMHACARPSFDTRALKPLGTMTVPCLVVIIIAEGSVVCSCWASAGVTGICSTVAGAQSWPPQHSFGYQSWARTLPATAKIIAASSVFGIFIPPLPVESTKPERRLFASPLRSEIAAVLVSVVDCVLGADAYGEAD